MSVETEDDLKALKKIGKIVANILRDMAKMLEPGIKAIELDQFAAKQLDFFSAKSAPMLAYDFPGYTCISINENIAHGIPGDEVINAGDIVNIDVSAELNGYYADTGGSFIVPPESKMQRHVCRATKEALQNAMKLAKAGNKLNRIGLAISQSAKKNKLKTIDNLCSHGVGRSIHEYPTEITNYYDPLDKRVLSNGLVITIEPFLSTLSSIVHERNDGWTLYGEKGNIAAQYEHSMVITKTKPIILTLAD
jgi:methionyl aminopeptidase